MTDRVDDLLRQLAELADDVGPALVPAAHEELVHSIIETVRRLFDAAACSVGLLSESMDELTFYAATGAGAGEITGVRVPAGQGIAGWVVMSGQPIAVEDVTGDPRFATDVAESTGYVPRSIVAMPLETDRRMLGVIEVLDGAEGPQEMELLALCARQAALAIESSRVFADFGRALFASAARATSGDLRSALEHHASEGSPRAAELSELALAFCELRRVGPEEGAAGVRLLREFLRYVERRR